MNKQYTKPTLTTINIQQTLMVNSDQTVDLNKVPKNDDVVFDAKGTTFGWDEEDE